MRRADCFDEAQEWRWKTEAWVCLACHARESEYSRQTQHPNDSKGLYIAVLDGDELVD